MKQYKLFIYLLIGLFLFSCSLKKRNNIFDPKKEEVKAQVEIESGGTGRISTTTPILKLTSPWEKTDEVNIKIIGSDKILSNDDLKGTNSFFNKIPNWIHFTKTIKFESSVCPILVLTNEEKKNGGALRYIYVLFKGKLAEDEKIAYSSVILDQEVQYEFSIVTPENKVIVGLNDKIIFRLKLKEEVLTVGKPSFNNIAFSWNIEGRKENDGWVYEAWYTIKDKPIMVTILGTKTQIKDPIDTLSTTKRTADTNIMKNFYAHEEKNATVSIVDKSGNKEENVLSANKVMIKTRYISDAEIIVESDDIFPIDYPCYIFSDLSIGKEGGTSSPVLTIPANAKIYFGVKDGQVQESSAIVNYSLCSLKVIKGALKAYSIIFETKDISLQGWKTETELPKWEGIYFGQGTELSELIGCSFRNYNISPYSFFNNDVVGKVTIK